MSRFAELYKDTIHPALMKELDLKNAMEVPRLSKIVLNMGVGEGSKDQKKIEAALRDMTAIAGQKPVATLAKNSIAGFKIRDGMAIGVKVTLRGERMFEFLDRLITVALPRVKDFQGVSGKGFDGRGNYSMGLKEQLVFVEIDYDKIDEVRGMDINMVTTAKTNEAGKALLAAFGVPFIK